MNVAITSLASRGCMPNAKPNADKNCDGNSTPFDPYAMFDQPSDVGGRSQNISASAHTFSSVARGITHVVG